ncbi:MAG TPA: hypothetical protein VJL54_05910 [Nitrososphaera sp.]|nr:hypothetical protein [Nitrososphaera sp.]
MTKPLSVAVMLPLTVTILAIAAIPNISQLAAHASTGEDVIGGGPDSDADGLSDSFEAKLGSDPTLPDSDSDGLADGFEHTGGDSSTRTDPTESDTDSDGLSDSLELLTHSTNPLAQDTDGDGVTDNIEVWHGSDPQVSESFFVLPESPLGTIAMILASMGAFAGFLYARRVRTPPATA